MQASQFQAHARAGFNRIPLSRELLADLDTPLSVYLKLADAPLSYLFESVQGGERWGRYSIIGLPARRHARVRGNRVEVHAGGHVVETVLVEDPLAWIADWQQSFRVAPVAGLPRFTGGLVGSFAYDAVRYIEPRLGPCPLPDPLDTPDILLMVSEEVVVFDNLSGRVHVVVNVDPADPGALERGEDRLDEIVARLRTPLTPAQACGDRQPVAETDFVSGFGQDEFCAAVARVKGYIHAGDVMQTVLSQRLSVPYGGRSVDIYRALRCFNPSPYLYHLDFGDFQVAGSSPEILVRLEDGRVTVRPLAGTRRRGRDAVEDKALESDLLADPKERAEHLMLIDLGRNDIGRVSETGSVCLEDRMLVERYSHVMHIVSHVSGALRAGLGAMDVLRACLPAGTVSGAPKVRAMELIDELEPVRRGVYAGAIGYLGWNGNLDTAIAIRTALIKDGRLHVQAGAGIVHDSVPETEWEETMNKGRALFHAAALAARGLDGADLRDLQPCC